MKCLHVMAFLGLILGACAPTPQGVSRSLETIEPQLATARPDTELLDEPIVNDLRPGVNLRSSIGTDAGEVATSVVALESGGYIVAGYEYTNASSVAEWDALVMRIDADGEQVWRRSTGQPGSDYAWVVRPAGPNQFAVVGTIEDGTGSTDGYLQVIDDTGEELWMETYGGEGDEILWAAEPHPDGGFLLVGETDSIGKGGLDVYVVRADDQGQEMWSSAYGTESIDRAFGLAIAPDGGSLIAGFTGERSDRMNLFFLRLNSDGRELWRRTIAGDRFDVAHDVLRLADGGFMVSGYTSSFSPGDHDGFLMKLTPGGRMLWMRTYGNDGDDRILHVAELPDGGFAMIGYSDWDVVVWRVDTDGRFLWSHRDGSSSGTDVGKDLIVGSDGSIIAVGGTQSDNPPKDDILLLVLREENAP